MTHAIIAGIIGILAGYGVGSFSGLPGATEPTPMMDGRGVEARFETPVADDYLSLRPSIASLATEALSTAERDSLIFMREEEKLARDVYTTLYEKWQTPIFTNIAQSEQTHTESVRQLLEKYEIPDPVTDDTVGAFTNPELQRLYDELTTTGATSLEAALRVGALIEDLDIADLNEALAVVDNADITLVYENLRRGSRNHLRSFTMQLERLGVTYEPTHLSVGEYEAIVTSEHERGRDNRGWGGGHNQGGRGNGGNGAGGGNGGGQR